MKTLFLDIDGVLNINGGERQTEPHLVERLNKIMPHIDALVISSAWRMHMHYGDMTKDGFAFMLFTHGVERMIGERPASIDYTSMESRFSEGILSARPGQIMQYVREHGLSTWAVLDDMPLAGLSNFVKVDPSNGLSERNVSDVLRILGAP